jgi:hypothetical protein
MHHLEQVDLGILRLMFHIIDGLQIQAVEVQQVLMIVLYVKLHFMELEVYDMWDEV